MNCRRTDYECRCSTAVVGYNSGASPGLIRLSKPHDFSWGFFVATFDFTTFDFWPFIAVKTGDSVKKEQKSGQKLRHFPNIQHFPGKYSHFRSRSGRGCGSPCGVRAVCAVWRVRRAISGVRGAGGILISVNRKTALRGL